jgi:CheY-like chemotaxis protein
VAESRVAPKPQFPSKLAAELLLIGAEDMNGEADKGNGKRILLVEDERVMRETLRRLFAQDFHTIVEANNGAEALSLFRSGKFDLVVMDFEMPFVKGDELAARIRQVAPNQPLLMLTAFQQRPTKTNPVDMVLSKPFNCARLRETVNKLLSQPSDNSDFQTERIERCPGS